MKKYISSCLAICCLSSAIYANDVKYNAQKIADIFYQLNADPKNPKVKVNHAKGFCAMGLLSQHNLLIKKLMCLY